MTLAEMFHAEIVYRQGTTPLHAAAAYGGFKFFKVVMDLSEVRHPKTEELETLLSVAAS